jgi:hypothetical protein
MLLLSAPAPLLSLNSIVLATIVAGSKFFLFT